MHQNILDTTWFLDIIKLLHRLINQYQNDNASKPFMRRYFFKLHKKQRFLNILIILHYN